MCGLALVVAAAAGAQPAAPASTAASAPPALTQLDAWQRLGSEEVAERLALAAALGECRATWAPAALWALAADADLAVRQGALVAAEGRCRREPVALCVRLLALVARPSDDDVAWDARDQLLARDLEAALGSASGAYKTDLIGRLGADPSLSEPRARRLLRRLSVDSDVEVQDRASWLLER